MYPVRDFEYGVPWESQLLICGSCGLVTHDPAITAEDIPELYPSTYHAYTGGSQGKGLYWKLRKAWATFAMRGVLSHLPRGGRLLEVGCGNGSFLRLVAEARPDVALHGIDIVDTHIEDIPGLVFHEGMLETTDLPGDFDVIYFNNLIEHVPDPVAFLDKCYRILRPGGVIYGNTPDHLSLDRYLFGRYWAGYHYPRHTFVFNHDNMRKILEQCGYEDIELKGSYAFWSLSLRNIFMERHGPKKRGLVHAAITIGMLPFDLLVNVFRCHGAMTFIGRAPARDGN